MKKFFQQGKDYKQFSRIHLEDVVDTQQEESTQVSSSFFHSYLLIHPDKSRLYDLWEVIMMNTYLLELALVPYVIFIDITLPLSEPLGFYYYVELTIDILHAINMAFIFVTAIPSD